MDDYLTVDVQYSNYPLVLEKSANMHMNMHMYPKTWELECRTILFSSFEFLSGKVCGGIPCCAPGLVSGWVRWWHFSNPPSNSVRMYMHIYVTCLHSSIFSIEVLLNPIVTDVLRRPGHWRDTLQAGAVSESQEHLIKKLMKLLKSVNTYSHRIWGFEKCTFSIGKNSI